MSTLADPQIREAFRIRLRKLDPDRKPIWGRMNAHQMICHLTDSFRVGTGERYASPSSNLLMRTLGKWIALRTSLPWPQGVPTRPEVEQGKGGTPPGSWEADCADLQRAIQAFAERDSFGTHPTFGKLTPRDWQTWAYRHVDHHFRQNGN